jgi:class 3 adenylate cyclase
VSTTETDEARVLPEEVDPETTAVGRSEAGTGATRSRRPKRRRPGLSIQSKLLIMLLSVSLLSSIVVGIIGFVSGRESLRAAAIDQLTTIRELRADELEHVISTMQTGVTLDSRNLSAQNASIAFNEGFEAAESQALDAAQTAELEAYHADTFVPELEARSGDAYDDRAFIPDSNAGKYLQYHYTAQFPDFDTALATMDAGDGSAWSVAHARYHDYFQRLIGALAYEDVLLLDTSGNVVYTAYSGVDLGTNLDTGPYRESLLADAYREVMATNSVSAVVTTDFERYIPSLNVPTLWVVSPIGNSSRVTGAFAAQIPIDAINDPLTGDERWKEQGLGDTGEVYVAGRDGLMRSISRLLVENPDAYAESVIANGTPPEVAARIVEVGGTVLLQPVETESVEQALRGRSGTTISTEYVGDESITAYTPVEIDGLDWVAVARIDTAEAFAPVTDFTRNLVISTLAILLAVSLLSMVLAQVFTHPIRRLSEAVRRVAGGDLTVQVPANSRDEFGDLGNAFNDMSSSLRIKQELIDEQKAEYDRLLLTVMPEPVARRYREGEETIAQDHQDVSVVFAELVGFDDVAAGLTSEEELALLNGLMRSFDEAAERIGVEKVRTLRGAYLASSGLIVPRVDNVRRAVDFAVELRNALDRFNAQHGASVAIRAGVDTGTVTSGLVGRTNLAYDLWGDAVSLAHRVQGLAGQPGIYVSQSVRDRLQDSVTLTRVGSISEGGVDQAVWMVE